MATTDRRVPPLAQQWGVAVRHWRRTDPALARLARLHPPAPVAGRRGTAFYSLTRALVAQQISVAAARTIMARLVAAAGGAVTPARVRALGPHGLRAAGLSPQKQGYLLDLADHFASGRLHAAKLSRLPDQDVIAALTPVRGIGEWTAKMFLIFHLQRADVLAHDDLGLQAAASKAFGVSRAGASRWLQRRSQAWRPYRSLASLVLWQSLHNTPVAKART